MYPGVICVYILSNCSSSEIQEALLSHKEEEEVWSRLWPTPEYQCTCCVCRTDFLWGRSCSCCPGLQWNLPGLFQRHRDNTQGSTQDALKAAQTLLYVHICSGFHQCLAQITGCLLTVLIGLLTTCTDGWWRTRAQVLDAVQFCSMCLDFKRMNWMFRGLFFFFTALNRF